MLVPPRASPIAQAPSCHHAGAILRVPRPCSSSGRGLTGPRPSPRMSMLMSTSTLMLGSWRAGAIAQVPLPRRAGVITQVPVNVTPARSRRSPVLQRHSDRVNSLSSPRWRDPQASGLRQRKVAWPRRLHEDGLATTVPHEARGARSQTAAEQASTDERRRSFAA